jgi:hypothetical protein
VNHTGEVVVTGLVTTVKRACIVRPITARVRGTSSGSALAAASKSLDLVAKKELRRHALDDQFLFQPETCVKAHRTLLDKVTLKAAVSGGKQTPYSPPHKPKPAAKKGTQSNWSPPKTPKSKGSPRTWDKSKKGSPRGSASSFQKKGGGAGGGGRK